MSIRYLNAALAAFPHFGDTNVILPVIAMLSRLTLRE